MDPRYQRLAELMVGHSTGITPGEHVLIQLDESTPFDMRRALVEAVRKAGGICLQPIITDSRLLALTRTGTTPESLAVDANAYLTTIRGCQARLGIRGYMNPLESKDVPSEDMQRLDQHYTFIIMPEAIGKVRWVFTEWPTPGFAALGNMSTQEAEDFFFNAVLADYGRMETSIKPLAELMDRTKMVRIIGPDETNLTFSIENIPCVPCFGYNNLPDGECFTAPVRDSMNGVIQYNTVSITRNGDRFSGVRFVVKAGRIIDASCQQGDHNRLQSYLNTDEGARYFGEWSLGLNWGVTHPIGSTLFDEKIGGTFHLTPGKAYDEADNGNRSGIHWDIVCDQREKAGGGDIQFDDVLVRRNGIFVRPELAGLNPPGRSTGFIGLADQPPHSLAF